MKVAVSPDANRYMEEIVVRLIKRYPTELEGHKSYLDMISFKYHHIAEMVMQHSNLKGTGIQLVDINHSRLTKWYDLFLFYLILGCFFDSCFSIFFN